MALFQTKLGKTLATINSFISSLEEGIELNNVKVDNKEQEIARLENEQEELVAEVLQAKQLIKKFKG